MGRKPIHKTCVQCSQSLTRMAFSRLQWETPDHVCRKCTVLPSPSEDLSLDVLAASDDMLDQAPDFSIGLGKISKSLRSKRRRSELKSLFAKIGRELGMDSKADQVSILQRVAEVIASSKEVPVNRTMTAPAETSCQVIKNGSSADKWDAVLEDDVVPLLSMSDILPQVMATVRGVTHSPMA